MHVDVHGECMCYVVGGCNVVATEHGRCIETVSSAGSGGYVGSFNFML